MKTYIFLLLVALSAQAQESAGVGQPGVTDKDMTPWLWANFVILMGGLIYLFRKYASSYFVTRSEGISRDIVAAEKTQAEASAKVAEINLKLSHLDGDLTELRESNRRDQAREAERLEARHQAELTRIHEQTRQEIEAATKAARLQLQRDAARLALDLAEQKVSARMNPESQKKLASEFVESLS